MGVRFVRHVKKAGGGARGARASATHQFDSRLNLSRSVREATPPTASRRSPTSKMLKFSHQGTWYR